MGIVIICVTIVEFISMWEIVSSNIFKTNKAAVALLTLLVNVFFSCGNGREEIVSNADTLTVAGSVVYVYDNFLEDSVLQKENINKDRRIIFELRLKNNSSTNKYIPIHGLWDYKYKSKLGFYVNGIDISGICVVKELNDNILFPHDSTVVKVRVRDCDLAKASLREYDKDVRDTVYSKYPIADMRISLDKNIVIEHKSYKDRKTFMLL